MKQHLLIPGILIVWLMACFPQTTRAQNKVSGAIKDVNSQPLSAANVLLVKAADSGLVKGKVTDKDCFNN